MTSETSYEKAGYCLEYLQSLRSEIDRKANELGLDIQWMIGRLCTFSCESDFSKSNKDYGVDENWLRLLSVYHNLLRRGIPTYPTAQIEEILIAEATKVFPFDKSNDEATITFRDKLTGSKKEEWLEFLVKAHAAIDYRCDKLQGVQDSEEEKAFMKYASEEVGLSVFQLLECQRRLDNMTETSDFNEIYEQRVDFSLETKDTKKVIEIDGEQHLEEKQTHLDKQREVILRKNNWDVLRIPARKVRQGQIDEVLEDLTKAFSDDPFLRVVKEGFGQPINMEEYGRAALLLTLTPIAIARIQWALNWAFIKGKLDLNQEKIRIAIVEEDLPCAFLAVWDFVKSLNYLKSLAEIESSLPKIDLEIIRNNDFDSFSDGISSVPDNPGLNVHVSRIDRITNTLQNHFDLIIAISSLHVGTRSPRLPFGPNNWVAINSVFTKRGINPRYRSESPISYTVHEDNPEELRFFLQWIFRKKTFLDGQLKILERSLGNKDVIGLLPTGGGKSLCYQLSAMLQPGMTLIVDPLISLMHDQIDNLKQLQIDAVAYLSSDQNWQEKEKVTELMNHRSLLMLFISPERLQIQDYRKSIGNMCLHTSIPYLVIDEAHCVSEWGHDFRPSYLRLADTARKICRYHEHKPSVIALTGTASWDVLTDIQREIGIDEEEAVITPESFDRTELEYNVIKCSSDEKIPSLVSKIRELPHRFKMSEDSFFTNENAGIVFCPHVNGQYGIKEVASEIHKELPDLIKNVGTYSGSEPRLNDEQAWAKIKIETQKAFKENRLQLMVATKAFGMGIDKPNIRYTIHYNIPISLEAFYQEAGRAGRDKKRAICIIVFSGESSLWKELNTTNVTIEKLIEMPRKNFRRNEDDIDRLIYFHKNTWIGIEAELHQIMKLFDEKIQPIIKNLNYDDEKSFLLPFNATGKDDENLGKTEKALCRLSALRLISDYTIDYRTKQFEVKVANRSDESLKSALLDYFARYKPPEYAVAFSQRIEQCQGQSVLEKCLRVMLEFVYEEIEMKRRQAIFNMAEVADTSPTDEIFRMQLLDYLEKSEFTKQLADIAKRISPMEWVNVASKVIDYDSARHLYYAGRKPRESYPDHPGLMLLSAFSRIMIHTLPTEMAIIEFQRAVKSLARPPEHIDTRKALASFLDMIKQRRPALADRFCGVVLEGFPQRDMARAVLKHVEMTSQSGMFALRILLNTTLVETKLVRAHILGGEPT
jgi:ATP-dependent DNA helicase RecQ